MEDKIAALKDRVQREVPQFVEAVKEALKRKDTVVMFHQDAYAADYSEWEYFLLGNVVKYAGLFGLELHIIGKNRETL